MKRYEAALVVMMLALTGCQSYAPERMDQAFVNYAKQSFADGKTLVVWNNGGGSVAQTAKVLELMRKGLKVEIAGSCGSSCTLLLIEENICYRPDANFKFHASSGVAKQSDDLAILAMLPERLAGRLRDDAGKTGPEVTPINAGELARLDNTDRTCRS